MEDLFLLALIVTIAAVLLIAAQHRVTIDQSGHSILGGPSVDIGQRLRSFGADAIFSRT